ncbi:pyruvate kinase [Alginatibacterium sediminis]|uniref:Pyruvate kinase n=1 Tax=Alginatibacterium sediminis TaxID=2164068 RepID=A0A420ENC1_9ALTE|nr:pyruvate kinase [Alginatibacterium sediminis]RKF22217.1 pyruvate kinase [Alginatibacterium sediminis]
MLRRTKIVATLGPATDSPEMLEKILLAGVNMVRLNFSHGTADDQKARARLVHRLAKQHGLSVAILGDLQGPKIRVSTFKDGKVELKIGDHFTLDSSLEKGEGTQQAVGLDYKELVSEVVADDMLLLDDGRIQLKVLKVQGTKVLTEVTVAGFLSNNKGINKKGGGLSAEALTEKDKADIMTAAEIGVDYLAVSFPQSGRDMEYARKLCKKAGLKTHLVAKVERAETVASDDAMIDIILASDAVMVARGDLGVEIGDPELVGVQKKLIRLTRKYDRAVITATQMMESMISAPLPTRAEVMDVANAVLDGTDAVMLSGETAVGQFPQETIEAMANVCVGAEKERSINVSKYRINDTFETISETMAMATMFAANHMQGMKAIISLTESGNSALLASRLSSGLPIFALSRHQNSLRRCALYRGVYPIYFDFVNADIIQVANKAIETLREQGYLASGDLVILTHGDSMDLTGSTNTCKILKVS